MPKLNAQRAKEVGKADMPDPNGGFTLVPDGLYLARLTAVTVLPPKEKGKFPQWQCEYSIIEDITDDGSGDTHKDAKLMDWLSLSDKAYPIQLMHEFFSAFEVEADADTDDLVGSELVLEVSHSVRTQGKRNGQEGNDIVRKLPANFDPVAPAADPGELGEEPF